MNYYWFKIRQDREKFQKENGLLIGRLRYGWVFCFKSYSKRALITCHQWREATKHGYIYNEYGSEILWEDFWEVVNTSKEQLDETSPLSFEDIPEGEREGVHENNGFIFIEGI